MKYLTYFLLHTFSIISCGQTSNKNNSTSTHLATTEFKSSSTMDKKEFWRIINYSFEKSNHDKSLQEKIIIDKLKTYTADQIVKFELIFRQLVIDADDFKVMAAKKIIEGSVSDDAYLYFRCWLIGQGEKTFLETLKNPDFLADLVDKQTESNFEELMYVATTAFEQKTGKKEEDDSFPRSVAEKKGLDYDFGAPPTKGTDWKTEQLPKLYPKLWATFN